MLFRSIITAGSVVSGEIPPGVVAGGVPARILRGGKEAFHSNKAIVEIVNRSLGRTSFTLVMLAIAGTMALALGILGIYGVISYAVSQRTREIGIRMALGAKKSELTWMFVRSALVLTTGGTIVGLGAAAEIGRAHV